MKRISCRSGANDLIPFFVLVGAGILIIGGLVFADVVFLSTDSVAEDQGLALDEKQVDYGEPYAYMEVERYGVIKIELDPFAAPEAVKNFKKLCDDDFYDGLIFHRVIEGFMIQGGDPNGDGTGGPGYTIPNEANNGLVHDRGVIACAKRGGETRMSGSQFYITHAEAHHLDGEHTVFGKVVDGMDIVDSIATTQTDANDRPLNTVLMTDVYVVYE